MKSGYFLSLLTLLIVTSFNNLVSQDFGPNINFKSYSTKEGLSQRSVTCIFQDSQGYLWLGTRYGLNKFDGKKFTRYFYDAENPNSLNHNGIADIREDKKGVLWIATRRGLNKYNSKLDHFERVETANHTPYNNKINQLKTNNSFLWVATNSGLHHYNTNTGHVLRYIHNKNNSYSISSNLTQSILMLNNNSVMVATDEAIDILNPKNNTFLHIEYPNFSSPKTTGIPTVVLFQDNLGNIWLGYSKGLAKYDPNKKKFIDFLAPTNTIQQINSPVRSIYEDIHGNLWVGAYNGLYRIESGTKSIARYVHDVANPNSLSHNSVYAIHGDARGDLWVGTWGGGVNYLDHSSNMFKSFSEGPNKTNLNYKVVGPIWEAPNKDLWFGTEGGGINILNRRTQTFSYLTHNPLNTYSLGGDNVKAITADHSGNLWVGTHDEGITKITFNNKKLKYTHFKSKPRDSIGLSSNRITCIQVDKNNNVWIATNDGGLNLYDHTTKKISKIKKLTGPSVTVLKIANTEYGMWVGGNSLYYMDTRTKEISRIKYRKANKAEPVHGGNIISILETPLNQLWIGTDGYGLYSYNLETHERNRYGRKDGLPDEVIYGILSDDDQNLWVSTNNGISKFNTKNKEFRNFNYSDGLQDNEFNYGSSLKTSKGELIFGGTEGFTLFKPDLIQIDSFVPPITIRSLNVRDELSINVTDSLERIVLKYNDNDIRFDFVALGFSRPNKNMYKHILEGFDEQWVNSGNEGTALYTNLGHGEYTFRAKAANSDGLWNDQEATVILKISPPLWKTWWAYTLYSILFSVSFYLVRKITLLRIEAKKALEHERSEKIKVEELNRLKLQLFTNISHDFRTPLTLIIGSLQRIISGGEKNGDAVRKQLSSTYRNATILLQLINQLLDFRKAESGKLKLRFSKNDITSLINNIVLSFDGLADRKHINLIYDPHSTPSPLYLWFDNIEIKKVLLNLLSNAFKFTPASGTITVKVFKDFHNPNELKITIQDNGKGIPKKDIGFIFNRYFQLGRQNQLRSGTGIGLAVAKDIITAHKGTIEVHSKEGEGTCFIISLPTGSDHIKKEDMVYNEESDLKDNLPDFYEPSIIQFEDFNRNSIDAPPIAFDDSKPYLLIVEDNLEVRNLAKSAFVKDFNIIEANNGKKGIKKAQKFPVDIIISDVMMPKMDGMEMCHQLKSDILTSHIPIILLTARTSSKMQKKGYETGADVYLTKPFDIHLLRLQVENLLKSRKHLIEKFKKNLLVEPSEITVVSADEEFLTKAMGIIEENISNSDFNVSSFINQMNMSQSVLYRKLKVLTGQSISEFVRTIRLKRAGQLLLKTSSGVSEIAYDVGFNDLKYFRKCFKSVFNQTPSQYRKPNIVK